MNKTLIIRDSKNKIRVIDIICRWDEVLKYYTLYRNTYQLGGKIVSQPEIIIDKGKAKRTVTEQATLVFNSNVNSYLDKGYKDINTLGYIKLSDITDFDKLLVDNTTDNNGSLKPMLAKSADTVSPPLFNNTYYASRKLDGTRCLMWYDVDSDQIKTSSRGGKKYDVATTFIRNNECLINYLKNNPGIILDGEIYKHGISLNVISGICRLQTLDINRHSLLQYHIYDLAINEPFIDRKLKLDELKTKIISNNINIVDHVLVSTWKNIKELHDNFVKEGYEGCVIRDLDANYGFNKRDNRMIKIKEFEDDEFKITGLEPGLRDEDMCFILETKKGDSFKAKPIGDKSLKESYIKNITNIIGKMGTVKYFGYTPYGIPNLPIFKTIRNYE